jgi:ankyrin repeat protein
MTISTGPTEYHAVDLPRQINFGIELGLVWLLDAAYNLDNDVLYDMPPVMLKAVSVGHLEVVEWLISKGEPITAKSIKWACRDGKLAILKALMAKSNILPQHAIFNVILSNSHTKTEATIIELITFFIDNGAEYLDPRERLIEFASEQNRMEVVKFLVEKGCDINVDHGIALCRAIEVADLDKARRLVELGADKKHVLNEETNRVFRKWLKITCPAIENKEHAKVKRFLMQ